MRFSRLLIFCVYLLVCSFATAQQDCGLPYITNYSSKEYLGGTDNWSITQDKRGVMYFGNSTGILEYDGVTWRMTALSIESIVRALDVDSSGRVYAGGVGDFGYLSADLHGNSRFISLVNKLPEHERDFGDVAKVYCASDGVYFTTFRKLYYYHNDKITGWEPENQFHFSFLVNNELVIMDRGIGFKVIRKGRPEYVKGSYFLSDDRVYAMIPLERSKVLVSARENGLYIFDPTASDSSKTFTKFKTVAEGYLLENQVYHGVKVNDTLCAFATLRGGVCFVGISGKYMKVLDKKNALRDDNIKYLFVDRQDGLWMAMDNGIARAEINSPLLFYADISGLKGSVQDVIRYNGKLYVAGTAGLFLSDNGSDKCFRQYEGIASQVRDLLVFDDKLLAATGNGVVMAGKPEPQLIAEYNAFKLYRSVTDPSRVFVGTSNGIAAIKNTKDGWKDEGFLEGIDLEINTIGEDNDGTVFVSTRTQGIRLIVRNTANEEVWRDARIIDVDKEKGLPDTRFNFIFNYKGGLIFSTLQGIHVYDKQSGKLVPDARFKGLSVNGTREIFAFEPQGDDMIWMSTANESIKETGVAILKGGRFEWFSKPFKHFSESEIHCIFPEKDLVWLGGPDGLISFEQDNMKESSEPFAPLFRKITMGKDSVYFMGGFNGVRENGKMLFYNEMFPGTPEFDYSHNSIELEFAAPVFDNEKKNLYRWFLEGYDKTWTAWTREFKTQYTNLPEGKYILHLQAKDIYDNISEESLFSFEIRPPWYRTVYAYAFYVVAFLALVYGVVQVSVRRLKKAKIQLEQMVQERTAEVVKQKEEIENQKLIVDQKNKDITDSINYASRIQQAILPVVDELKESLPDAFVLFRPRDIVSGDFYWFYRKGKDVLVAAADCTGHGVPGAFMSMIGHTLLNDIVAELQVPHPDLILNQLNVRIRSSLRQDQQNESRDGMDIALCKIDLESRELEFAGAMRPLYLIRNGELEEIKADKVPIGGLQEAQEKRFNRHTFSLNKGDGFYLSSDGYADQFGGNDGKKFMTKKFKELLASIFPKDAEEQRRQLLASFLGWQGEYEQVDDILVIGVKL